MAATSTTTASALHHRPYYRPSPPPPFICVQGGDKKEWEDVEFAVMLPNINLLYLFCSVLVLLDLSYMSRFWTQFEAFLSLRKVRLHRHFRHHLRHRSATTTAATSTLTTTPQVSAAGLDFAPAAARRCAISCIHNAPGAFSEALVGMWGQKTAEEAYDFGRVSDLAPPPAQLPVAHLPLLPPTGTTFSSSPTCASPTRRTRKCSCRS